MVTIMKRQEVVAVTGLCYTSIYNKEKRGEFPARRQLGTRSVGWIRHEVEAWVNGLQQVACPVAIPIDVLSTMVIR
jgi:predicted DNA-binding transcriptional regulator AlpA